MIHSRKQNEKFQDWKWPEKGLDGNEFHNKLCAIPSPYEEEIPPFCFPGTTLQKGILGRAKNLLYKQINSIGCHTHLEVTDEGIPKFKPREGGFEVVQRMEAQAIWMVASVLGGSPTEIDGYFCGGGTEANIEGIWIGREWLRKCPDPFHKGICVFATPLQHCSIAKAIEMVDIGHHQ